MQSLWIHGFRTVREPCQALEGHGTRQDRYSLVPMHDELKPGTLRSVLKLAKVDPGEFAEYL